MPLWRCSAFPFFIIHPQICREGLRLFHSFLCRGVFLLIGVTRSPCLSELNVINVTVTYHQLFGAKANIHSLPNVLHQHEPFASHLSKSITGPFCLSLHNFPAHTYTGVVLTPVIQRQLVLLCYTEPQIAPEVASPWLCAVRSFFDRQTDAACEKSTECFCSQR